MFKTNDYLEGIIENKNIVRIRSAFTVIAHEDPSFSTGKFMETLEYVKSKNIDGLFVTFDDGEFKSKDEWDEDYWALIVASLVDNFCMERIKHLREVSGVLYPPKTDNFKPSIVVDDYKSSKSSNVYFEKRKKYDSSKKMIPIAITAGLAITCVAAIAVGSKWTAVIAGTATIVMGMYMVRKN